MRFEMCIFKHSYVNQTLHNISKSFWLRDMTVKS